MIVVTFSVYSKCLINQSLLLLLLLLPKLVYFLSLATDMIILAIRHLKKLLIIFQQSAIY